MVDQYGYRPNVAIIITNAQGQLFWARRIKQHSWQFPQGGVDDNESVLLAMYRELYEEVGLRPWEVKVLAVTPGWFRYQLPEKMLRSESPECIGQKQKWFLLKLLAPEQAIHFNTTDHPEFDDWRWVEYWYPLNQVISFKRHVYRKALERFNPVIAQIQNAQRFAKPLIAESSFDKTEIPSESI